MSNKVYDAVTKEVIKKLKTVQAGDFTKPWFSVGHSPYNAISKKTYRGINYITLGGNDYKSKAYASFKQWKEKGCNVIKGEKAHMAVFWKLSSFEDKDTGEQKTIPFLRFYNVFNSEQVKGDYAREIEQRFIRDLNGHDPIECAQNLVENYLANERLKLKVSDRAYYSHSMLGSEYIAMPLIGQFKDAGSFYSVFFHEMGHSTGHDKRLNRDLGGGFGSKRYAIEELIAELTSAMLAGAIGMSQKPRLDHAQYIASWLQALKNDNRFIVQAAGQAQKAADFIQASAANYQDWKEQGVMIAAE